MSHSQVKIGLLLKDSRYYCVDTYLVNLIETASDFILGVEEKERREGKEGKDANTEE